MLWLILVVDLGREPFPYAPWAEVAAQGHNSDSPEPMGAPKDQLMHRGRS